MYNNNNKIKAENWHSLYENYKMKLSSNVNWKTIRSSWIKVTIFIGKHTKINVVISTILWLKFIYFIIHCTDYQVQQWKTIKFEIKFSLNLSQCKDYAMHSIEFWRNVSFVISHSIQKLLFVLGHWCFFIWNSSNEYKMKSTNAVENIIEKNKNIRFTVKQKKNKD